MNSKNLCEDDPVVKTLFELGFEFSKDMFDSSVRWDTNTLLLSHVCRRHVLLLPGEIALFLFSVVNFRSIEDCFVGYVNAQILKFQENTKSSVILSDLDFFRYKGVIPLKDEMFVELLKAKKVSEYSRHKLDEGY